MTLVATNSRCRESTALSLSYGKTYSHLEERFNIVNVEEDIA